jgi:hypothetical protein
MPITRPPELDEMARRLAADYRPRVAELGADLDVWANSTQVGVEIGSGVSQRRWAKKVRYAYRFVMLGKTVPLKSVHEVDLELRGRLEDWINRRRETAATAG